MRQNTVILTGFVKAVGVWVPENSGTANSRGLLLVETQRRRSNTVEEDRKNQNTVFEEIPVITENPELIKIINDDINENNLIMVKGNVTTYNNARYFQCASCGEITKVDYGMDTVVNPVSIVKLSDDKKFESDTDRALWLKNNAEISNLVSLSGTLVRDLTETNYFSPVENNQDHERDTLSFQVASNRLRFISEDDPDKRADFPWISFQGKESYEYFKNLRQSSIIFVEGALRGRSVKQSTTCAHCGGLAETQVPVMDVVPFHIEYVSRCGTEPETDDYESFDEYEENLAKD